MREVSQANEPPPTGEYPKWVGDKIAKNAEEEAEILRIMKEFEGRLPTVVPPLPFDPVKADKEISEKFYGPVDLGELAEFRAWKANRERLQEMARGSEKNEPVRRQRKPMTPERLEKMQENLAKARAARKRREPDLDEGF